MSVKEGRSRSNSSLPSSVDQHNQRTLAIRGARFRLVDSEWVEIAIAHGNVDDEARIMTGGD